MKITTKCPYCGERMFPRMRYEDNVFDKAPQFYLYCRECKASSPSTSFDSTFIDTDELVESINKEMKYKDLLDDEDEEEGEEE